MTITLTAIYEFRRPVAITDGTHTFPLLSSDKSTWPTRDVLPNDPVEITVTHPTDGRTMPLSVVFNPLKESAVDPIYEQWHDAGLITDELREMQPVPSPSIDSLKAAKLAELDALWQQQCTAGLPVDAAGVNARIGCRESDVALLTGQQVLATTAVQAGAASADGPFKLQDVTGQSHSFTLANLTVFLLTYGGVRAALAEAYGAAKVAINAASDADELDAVTLPEVM